MHGNTYIVTNSYFIALSLLLDSIHMLLISVTLTNDFHFHLILCVCVCLQVCVCVCVCVCLCVCLCLWPALALFQKEQPRQEAREKNRQKLKIPGIRRR